MASVVSTPATQVVCPRCHTPSDMPARFCGNCGADLRRTSPLEQAAAREGVSEEEVEKVESSWTRASRGDSSSVIDRRITASNHAWMGKLVDGRYKVTDMVGRGGMGVVYKVEHQRMGKIAAMKVLHPDLADDTEVIRRFEHEAAAVSRLNHPNTVQVFDFGQANGALYLIMEYVRGQDLGAIIDRDGPLPFARAAPLFHQICGALAEAHDLGIVHRDLKPENVLVTRSTGGRDFAKVLDFGLAKISARDQAPAPVTDRTEIVGTPYFMSPEQIRGDEVDARSDLYSMGALMYNVLTGSHVFTAKNAVGVLTKHLTAEVEAPSARGSDIDPRIDEIVLRALEKDPVKRWPSASALGEAIEQAYSELVGDLPLGTSSRKMGKRERTATGLYDEPISDYRLRRADLDAYERSLERRKLYVAGGLVLGALAVAAAIAWFAFLRTTPPSTSEHEPNDDLAHATLIAIDQPVTGYLGKRIGPHDPDRDLYRVVGTDDDQERVISVHVTGLPNIDESLTLLDAAGHVVATIGEGGVGGGEASHRRRVRGPIIVEIAEVMQPGQDWAVENVSDAYELTVAIDDKPGWEIEPDGSASDAVRVTLDAPMRGWLDSRRDVDVLRWDGPPGRYTVKVDAPQVLPIAWRINGAAGFGAGSIDVELATGDLIWLSRTDAARPEGQPLPGEEDPWTLTVVPR
ncbi:MAG TPA: serine/threonine-protein kinase [Kofleriaceae bacterium]|nr:serine/threonine-protein kinase [Kofleriaceae bacterium]